MRQLRYRPAHMRIVFRWALTGLGALMLSSSAWAKPVAPDAFCNQYPEAPTCIAGVPACTFCHAGAPPPRNAFGEMLSAQMLPGAPRPLSTPDFLNALGPALAAIEGMDADADAFTNLEEITAGTAPANGSEFPDVTGCGPGSNPQFDVCNYDPKLVFKKVNLDFCGQSPTWEAMEAFTQAADQNAALHEALDTCLDSEFWIGQHGQLWQLANDKIRPIQAIKQGEDQGPIPLGDYYDDYNLFAYAHMDDHDVRDVLLADYFVTRTNNPTQYTLGAGNQQTVATERRAGMLTSRWNLVLNVMFTAVPRTAAAQAIRSYLGADIAKLEGLYPVDGEPIDYDEKGVGAAACSVCHSTLDPATYAFTPYYGIAGNRSATYDPQRIARSFSNEGENITDMPETGMLMGQPVADLNEWAQVAANSEAFAKATALDYWRLLMGNAPKASEQEEFLALWQGLMTTDSYQVERMLHRFIETEAYGVP